MENQRFRLTKPVLCDGNILIACCCAGTDECRLHMKEDGSCMTCKYYANMIRKLYLIENIEFGEEAPELYETVFGK